MSFLIVLHLCYVSKQGLPLSDPNCLPSAECCSCQPLMDVVNSTGSLMALGTDLWEQLQSILSDVVFFFYLWVSILSSDLNSSWKSLYRPRVSVSTLWLCCCFSVYVTGQFLLRLDKVLFVKINECVFCHSVCIALNFPLLLVVILCRQIFPVCLSNKGEPFFHVICCSSLGILFEKVEILTAQVHTVFTVKHNQV